MACSWCDSNNGMWTDPDTGETKPCIKCNYMGGGGTVKMKGGNCAVIAVILLGAFAAAVVGAVEAVRQFV